MSDEIIPDGYRKCTKCNNIKRLSVEFFYINSNGKDGYLAYCKECTKKARRLRWRKQQDTAKVLRRAR